MEKSFTFAEFDEKFWNYYYEEQQKVIEEFERKDRYIDVIEEIDPISKRKDFLQEV